MNTKDKQSKLPCYKCIVLARCKSKEIIDCSILQDWNINGYVVSKQLVKILPKAAILLYPCVKGTTRTSIYVCRYDFDILTEALNKHSHNSVLSLF